jgi:hypothetical protein
MPDTIQSDVSETEGPLQFDAAVEALENLTGGEDLPEEEDEGDGEANQEETSDDDAGDESSEEDEGDEDETDPDEETSDEDEDDGDSEDDNADADGATGAEVEVLVDGQTHKVSVDDLKRLYGQEAALTRKSQEVADLRKLAQDQEQKYSAAMTGMIERAQEAWKPYSEIDWMVAPQNMSTEDFQALRADAKQAYENLQFLTSESETYMQERNQEAQKQHKEEFDAAVKAAHVVLADPEKGIPGWSEEVYNGIRTFAQGEGMEPEMINSIIDPIALKVLWKASQFDKSKKVATVKTKKAGAKKVMTTKGKSMKGKSSKAQAKLAQTGNFDDAVSALMELDA